MQGTAGFVCGASTVVRDESVQDGDKEAQRIMADLDKKFEKLRKETDKDKVTEALRKEAWDPTKDAIKVSSLLSHVSAVPVQK